MISIFSISQSEFSTEKVIDWLNHYSCQYQRINGDEFKFDYDLSNPSTNQLFKDTNVCWFRRWYSEDNLSDKLSHGSLNTSGTISFHSFLSAEKGRTSSLLWNALRHKKWLTDPMNDLFIHKIFLLEEALNLEIKIPESIITTSKKKMISFKKDLDKIITKPLSEPFMYHDKNSRYMTQTIEIDDNDLKNIPDQFGATLFQKLIEKRYEIRTFYLDGKFYSMAIFSQLDSKTQIDFRNYNKKKPNRTVPYKLPNSLEVKLDKLLKSFGINTGSIDLIKSIDGEYIFLEVNPVGQFGMTSTPCNYNLEKVIAQYLKRNDL